MNIHFDPETFRPLIETAIDATLRRLQSERPRDGSGRVLLNKRGAAEFLGGVSVATIDRWREKHGLPFVKLDGLVLFRPEGLREWAKAREDR